MLTRTLKGWFLTLVTLGGLLVALGPLSSPAGAAEESCVPPAQISYNPDGSYTCTIPGGGGSGDEENEGDDGGTGTPAEPTCELVGQATWCKGETACWTQPTMPPVELPTTPKPKPDSVALSDWCYATGVGTGSTYVDRTYWSDEDEPQEPPLIEQARTAVGQLNLALPPLATSPTDRTLVNLPTWFWVEGGEEAAEQTGSSAFGLVAIATVRGLSIETGDGETLTCDWVTSAEEAEQECSHVYTRATPDGPYQVEARSTWDIRFEVNGTPVEIPGAPTTENGPASTATLQVDEVQSTVEEVR